MKKTKDTDYIYAATSTRVMEKRLIDKPSILRICDDGSFEDVIKLCTEAGYRYNGDYEAMLSATLKNTYAFIKKVAPDPDVFDLFLLKNDYHNLKVVIKATALGQERQELLFSESIYTVDTINYAVTENNYSGLSQHMRRAAELGLETFLQTKNPQMLDLVFDSAMYSEIIFRANNIGNKFIIEFFKREIDLLNIKILMRMLKMGKNEEFAKRALIEGGNVGKSGLISLVNTSADDVMALYGKTPYRDIVSISNLAILESKCDDFMAEIIRQARFVSFGLEVLVAYLLAVKDEIQNLRIILIGKKNGISPEVIKSRLRL